MGRGDHPGERPDADPVQARDHRQRLRGVQLPLFLLTALITRGARFFLIAALLKRYGAPIQEFIEKRLTLIGLLFLAALAGGFAAIALI
jgi:hypothetical protein